MNDLHFIFYEAKRMYLDTSDMTCDGERAHRRLCDFIWFSDKPPLNNNESLRQITHTKEAQWGKVKVELIAKGWLEASEFLLHRGVIKTLNESKQKYVKAFNQTAKANKLIPLDLLPPDRVTGIVAISDRNPQGVTSGVTLPVTSGVTSRQSESQSQPESDLKRESPPPKRFSVGDSKGGHCVPLIGGHEEPPRPEVPTLEQAIAAVQVVGIPEDFIRFVFEDWSSRGGKDAGGVLVPWGKYVTKRWSRERVEWLNGKHRGKKDERNPGGRVNQRNVGMSETAADKTADVLAVLAARKGQG